LVMCAGVAPESLNLAAGWWAIVPDGEAVGGVAAAGDVAELPVAGTVVPPDAVVTGIVVPGEAVAVAGDIAEWLVLAMVLSAGLLAAESGNKCVAGVGMAAVAFAVSGGPDLGMVGDWEAADWGVPDKGWLEAAVGWVAAAVDRVDAAG